MDRSHLKLFNPHGSQCPDADRASAEKVCAQRANTERVCAEETTAEKATVQFARVIGEARVAVSVGDLLPLLAEAWQSKRAWLHDFSSDRVIVSQDLYEVLLAYQRYKHASAA
ncbi:MAG: hypothetical protein ACTHK7_10400 [Aureliella sp.]